MSVTKIEQNMHLILQALGRKERSATGEAWVSGNMLAEETGLQPAEINDAVDLLATNRLVEMLQAMGTDPYIFEIVTITSKGRYELERALRKVGASEKKEETNVLLPPTPVGSPYRFTDEDWEIVSERKTKANELRVVFGCQFQSAHYNKDRLKANIQEMFQRAVEEYNRNPNIIQVALHFQPLEAGYGEHLFNEIARDIISADIAVFETSDLNPNVMIEMGVALTWGVRVLPIKKEECPKPPSDISGQTWADYRNDGSEFPDTNHYAKLVAMIDRAVRKKGRA
jgi:hypothetical protein